MIKLCRSPHRIHNELEQWVKCIMNLIKKLHLLNILNIINTLLSCRFGLYCHWTVVNLYNFTVYQKFPVILEVNSPALKEYCLMYTHVNDPQYNIQYITNELIPGSNRNSQGKKYIEVNENKNTTYQNM